MHHPDFLHVPKILETPYIPSLENPKKTYPPYRHELAMLRAGRFDHHLEENVRNDYEHERVQ